MASCHLLLRRPRLLARPRAYPAHARAHTWSRRPARRCGYREEAHGTIPDEASPAFDAAIYPQVASMAGAVCGGYLADLGARRTCRGRMLVQCVGVMAGAPFVALCGLSGSLLLVKVALICWGFFKGIYDSNIFASAFDVVPAETRGTVSGSMNCVGWLMGGGLAPVLVGFLAGRLTLGTAIAVSSVVYVLAGLLLLLTMLWFLEHDANKLKSAKS